jgi:hypothetical protein
LTLDDISVKEFTASDMDVTRATAATRVDENGLVNYAEILGSELITDGDFPTGTTAWNEPSGWTLGNGVASWDAAGTFVFLTQEVGVVVGKKFKVTFDAVVNNGNLYVVLADGGETPSITESGSYEFILTPIGGGSSDTKIRIYQTIANSDFTITNISVKECTRDNVPRIDYTGGGCPHILAEPQRTNLLPYSEDFTQWGIIRATLGTNITAPNGNTDGYSIIATAINDDHYVFQNISVVNTTVYTYSAFLKKGSKSWARLWNTSVGYADFDLENGVVGTQSSVVGSIELINNGWYKCSIVYTAVSTASNSHRIYTLDGDNDKTFLGDGSTINLYIFGAQLEAGTYPTSYILTSGSAVTRNQDIFTRDGIGSLINSTEGVLFAEIAALSDDSTNRQLTLSDGSDTNRIVLKYDNQSNIIQSFNRVSGVETASLSATVSDITQFSKIAIKYKLNDYAMWIDGVEVDTDNSSTTFPSSTLNKLSFGTSSSLFAKVKQLQVYKTALTDAQLTSLTT